MLLKTRREFTLCFFLFVPLGMAGYCADVNAADSPVRTTNTQVYKPSKADAGNKGGQPAPQSPSGGISSAEQLTRLLVDGRRAFRDGEMITAKSYFRDALKLDETNAEAQKYLRDIEQKARGESFSPDALSAEIPAGKAGRVDVVATVEAVKANATPAPLTQTFGAENNAMSVGASGSVSMGTGNTFSKPVSLAVSIDGATKDAPKPAAEAPATAAKAEAADAKKPNAGQDALARLGQLAEKAEKQLASAAAADAVAEKQKADASKKAAAEKAAAEKVAAEKAEKAAATEKAAAEELARVKAEAEKAEREKADKILAEKQKAEETRLAAEAKKKAEEEKKAAAEAKKAEEARKVAEAKQKAADEKAAAEAAKKAERERKEAEAKQKAEDERLAAEAKKKAEEEKKAAEAKKAEEARQLAEAEKTAREAAKKAEQEKKIAQAAEDKKQHNKAVSATNEGISLYNAGKYAEAKEKFQEALASEPDYREATSYLARAERKLEPTKAKGSSDSSVLNLDQLNNDLKEVSQASSAAKAADATTAPASQNADDPIVRADKIFRDARQQLADGKRTRALELAREAAEIDPSNKEVAQMVADLSSSSGNSIPPITAQDTIAQAAATTAAVQAASDAAAEDTLDVATPVVSPPVIGMGPDGVASLLSEGRSKYESGQIREALTAYKAVLDKDPDNAEAKRYINKIEVARAGGDGPVIAGGPAPLATAQTAQDAEAAFQQGLVAYQAGRLDVAVQHWNFSLTLDPNHPRAIQYVEQTRPEYEAWVQQHQHNAIELQKEVSATNKLETGVTYDSAGQKTLVEFLQAMSFITDINFYVADGVDPDLRITAKFGGQPLQDALDIVLLPVGLKWHRTGDVVSVTTDLHNKFYNLTPDQVQRLKPLLENRTLQRYLYGPEGLPPMRNVELLLDDRENLLIVTDSVENLSKIEAFLKDLQVDAPQQLVFKNWKIRPEEGNRIKALVEAIVKVNSDAAWDLDRRVVVDGDDLIVKDTSENVAKIEQLLLDKNFLTKLQDQSLGVQSYSLIPREPIGPENVEQARDMAQSIVTVVKTILYSQSGEEAAAAAGRRFWYDPNTLQLTITDIPDNLSIVSDYIKSLPTLSSSEQKSEIIWLKHQTAPEMKGLLEQVLGLTGGVGGSVSSGNSVTKTLRTEGELVFGDLRVRVREIRGAAKGSGQNATQNQRTATLIVRTATNSQDVTLDEFATEFVDEYELTAEEIRPSGQDDGEGSIRLRVAVSPNAALGGGLGGGLGVGAVPGLPGGAIAPIAGVLGGSLSEELTMVVEAVPSMNALLIRYTNPSDLDEVRSWLKQLDVPVMQVSIETKLVEVNETRAKEFMPEFNWANIGHGSPDFSNSTNLFDFAKNDFLGEVGRSPFDPFPEDPFNAGLLKGTSVFNLVTGGKSPISFTLRALESEGVVNLTNGPTVTVENGETAEFQIARDFGLIGESLGQNSETQRVPRIRHVNMSVSPQITQAGEIRLDITDLQLNDFGNQIQNIWPIVMSGSGTGQTMVGEGGPAISGVLSNQTGWGAPATPIMASPVGNVPYEVRRRQLSTVARVKNHGTIVLGGWMGERSRTNDSGVPILRNLPYVGKLLFGRTSDKIDRTNLLIFLTCHLIDP